MNYETHKTQEQHKSRFKISKSSVLALVSILLFVIMITTIIYSSKKYPYSGTILNKEGETMAISGGKRQYLYIERYVTIKFDNGHTQSINLNPTSYYTAKTGHRITVLLSKDCFDEQNNWMFLAFCLSVIGFIVFFAWFIVSTTGF